VNTLDRLRELVRAGAARREAEVRELTYEPVGRDGLPIDRSSAPALPGASEVQTPFGAAAVIDRCYDANSRYGPVAVEEYDVVEPEVLALLTGRPIEPRTSGMARPVFLDIETTGLSGGAGTLAFLVGCGWFDRGAFRTRQFFLNGFAAERAVLHLVAELLVGAPFIVTYNGRTFDVPVMETRWQFHRMPPPVDGLPHVDMLPPARRLWRADAEGMDRGCRLVHLEEALLGVARAGDVPAFEIPGRYFAFVRGGDAAPLEPVLEHNRLDLLSLAAITARAQVLVRNGPDAARDGSECLALGRVFRRAARFEDAEACFRRAGCFVGTPRPVREDALHELARLLRRGRRHREAAQAWRELLGMGQGRSRAARDAIEALAIHHEHRDRDLATARDLALRSLRAEDSLRRREAVRYRLARLERKIAARGSRGRLEMPRLLDT
jgi:hypothetical protein